MHYAELAQRTGAETLVVGVELVSASHRENDWRRIVGQVRQRFQGKLVYASMPDRGSNLPGDLTRLRWWDALDYVGVDHYAPLATKNDPTVDELKCAWTERGYVADLENVSRSVNKQVIFTEVGYRSIDGAGRAPGVFRTEGTVDLQEQAVLYQAFLEVFWGKPWLAGIYWWQWFPYTVAPTDEGYTPHTKPAEQMLMSYYQR